MTRPLTIYCDRLGLANCLAVARAARRVTRGAPADLAVLDPVAPGWRGVLARRIVGWFGYAAEEVPFYAGHLRLPDGLPAQRAAADCTMVAALPESGRIVEAFPLLRRLNEAWGRDTVRLHACKAAAMAFGGDGSLYGVALRVQTARALALRDGRDGIVLVRQPRMFGTGCLQAMAPEIGVAAYGALGALAAGKLEILKQGVRRTARRLAGLRARFTRRQDHAGLLAAAQDAPGLLLLQEDDLGLDRSYRSQPHWLFPDEPPPGYNLFVLAHGRVARVPPDEEALGARRIRGLPETLMLAAGSGIRSAAGRRARRAAARCWWSGLVSRSAVETTTLAVLSRLFVTAAELADACTALRIRSFMTAENYLVPADAMALVAPELGITTLSYQYSNLAVRSPLMMTTADVMCTFAQGYHDHWTFDRIRPITFVDTGYPYDGAFRLVRERALAARQRLQAAGATCVLAYFDENFFRGTKYGLTTPEQHTGELKALLELVVSEPGVAVVTKVQFERNAASRIPELAPLVAAATATGRYLELVQGTHRNSVLPAEAALVADVAIGHAIGSTASLEAALTGTRSIMLNPYMMRDAHHPLYERADILHHDLPAALEAIAAFRRGERPALGDWSAILSHFDPHRDGCAARRLRAVVDAAMAGAMPA